MKDMSQVIDMIERELVRTEYLTELRDGSREVQAFYSNLKTLQAKADQFASDRDAALQAKAQAEAGIDAAKDQAAVILADAKAQAQSILSAAEAAKELAKGQASAMLADAKQRFDAALADAQTARDQGAGDKAAANAELQSIRGEVQAVQGELDALNDKLAKAKAAAAAMLG